MMLKLKLQYFDHLMQRTNSFEKTLMLGKIEGKPTEPIPVSIQEKMDFRGCLREWRSNQSILKELSPGISLEGMMLKLKLQYLGHLM